jgi:hypothetical protein
VARVVTGAHALAREQRPAIGAGLLKQRQQRGRGQGAHARGGQLQRQRQALQPAHQSGHGVGIAGMQLEVGAAGGRPFDEEPYGGIGA